MKLFIWYLPILFSFLSFSVESCENWSLPESRLAINDITQQDSGMCHAYRDSKALEFFHKSLGISMPESGVLEIATIFHRKLLFIKQIISKKFLLADYQKGESILDWGHTCEAINNILENGLCEKSIYSSSSYHYIYNLFRNLVGINLKECESCDKRPFVLSSTQKREWSKSLLGLTVDFIKKDDGLKADEKKILIEFVKDSLTTKKKTNYPKIVKSMERKVKRKCRKRAQVKVYNQYKCNSIFFPEVVDTKKYNEQALGHLKDFLKNRNHQPVMASICSAKLSSAKDPKEFTFNDGVGSDFCGPHAVLIVGQKKGKDGRCRVLVEDNYPGVCNQKDMPWAECEKGSNSRSTGRYWIDRNRFAPLLIGIGKISLK